MITQPFEWPEWSWKLHKETMFKLKDELGISLMKLEDIGMIFKSINEISNEDKEMQIPRTKTSY